MVTCLNKLMWTMELSLMIQRFGLVVPLLSTCTDEHRCFWLEDLSRLRFNSKTSGLNERESLLHILNKTERRRKITRWVCRWSKKKKNLQINMCITLFCFFTNHICSHFGCGPAFIGAFFAFFNNTSLPLSCPIFLCKHRGLRGLTVSVDLQIPQWLTSRAHHSLLKSFCLSDERWNDCLYLQLSVHHKHFGTLLFYSLPVGHTVPSTS